MNRKFVQIVVANNEDKGAALYALDNTGGVWGFCPTENRWCTFSGCPEEPKSKIEEKKVTEK